MLTSAGFNWNCSKIQGLWDVQQKSRMLNLQLALLLANASSLGISEDFNWNLQIFMIGFDMLTSAKKIMFSFEALISVPEGLRFSEGFGWNLQKFPFFLTPIQRLVKKTYFFFRPQINAPVRKTHFFSTFVWGPMEEWRFNSFCAPLQGVPCKWHCKEGRDTPWAALERFHTPPSLPEIIWWGWSPGTKVSI